MDRWVGKIAVVTGSSSGIGLAISIALVRKGMVVVGLARRKTVMEEAVHAATSGSTGKFFGYECDVTTEESVIGVFKKIKENFGTVHVLVNNAGTMEAGTILDTTSEVWQKTFNVNVMGALYCTQQAMQLMKESEEEGHVVMINSIQGHRVHIFREIPMNVYPASKHAITGLTESLQRENLGGRIRFTSISPGVVKTPIVEPYMTLPGTANMPLLEPEDIADSVVYVVGTPLRVQITELTIRPLGETNT
ncbi:farnesol dehydrogenase-like [Venturia canescens]|uniref:farnesol dehydrogenase-like n=1 Tax=Venturia canescens TaxID=32260 RepID=UPI001C9C8C1E|nr:farnesol dehydrogenase-like [Venturia canescens]